MAAVGSFRRMETDFPVLRDDNLIQWDHQNHPQAQQSSCFGASNSGDLDLFGIYGDFQQQTGSMPPSEPISVLDYAFSSFNNEIDTPVSTAEGDDYLLDFAASQQPYNSFQPQIGAAASMKCRVEELANELQGEIISPANNTAQTASMENMIIPAVSEAPYPGLIGRSFSSYSQTSLPALIESPTQSLYVSTSSPFSVQSSSGAFPLQQPPLPRQRSDADPQIYLVQMLLLCAQAVADENVELAHVILVRLNSLVSPSGSPMQRLASYFTEALAARVTRNTMSPSFRGLINCGKLLDSDRTLQADMLEAFSVFYDSIPIGKFAHLTMNQAILDAVEDEKNIHVIDLHLWFGSQWPAFLQALAVRPGGPPRVRMTAIGSSVQDLQETGRKLMECAKLNRVVFEYCPMMTELEKFHPGMLEIRPGEAVVINSLSQFHYMIRRGSNWVHEMLCNLKCLNPKLLVMAENDVNHNSPTFVDRFVECLRYYSAVFDAIDASLPANSMGRFKMEKLFTGPKIRNIVACEGPARVERHETMGDWSRRLEAAGFKAAPLSNRAISQATLLLNLYYSNGYTLHMKKGYLVLGWHGTPLNTVAAWRS